MHDCRHQAFGHKVAVVEARERPGGRVHTLRLEPDDPSSAPAGCCGMGELGGSVITGCDGNPLAVVARQLGAQLHCIRDKCVQTGSQPQHKHKQALR